MEKKLKKLLIIAVVAAILTGISVVVPSQVGEGTSYGYPVVVWGVTGPTRYGTITSSWDYAALFIDYIFYVIIIWVVYLIAAYFMKEGATAGTRT